MFMSFCCEKIAMVEKVLLRRGKMNVEVQSLQRGFWHIVWYDSAGTLTLLPFCNDCDLSPPWILAYLIAWSILYLSPYNYYGVHHFHYQPLRSCNITYIYISIQFHFITLFLSCNKYLLNKYYNCIVRPKQLQDVSVSGIDRLSYKNLLR